MKKQDHSHAEALAKALAEAGITSDEPELPAGVRANTIARDAFLALGDGGARDWLEMMQLRRSSPALKRESDRKLAALCNRAIEQADLLDLPRDDLNFACGYYCGRYDALK